ncbi:rhombosortase [Chromatiales bacterium (ex Bugula neritina AB1)]|nr:rhombosortase [Chromatiales bacterium (ex Bugula neritina AB1)]
MCKAYSLALALGAACLLLQATGLAEKLRFSRAEIDSGEWWRILTGNLVHLGYPHLFLNLAGLAIITLLLAHTMTGRQWFVTGLVSMLGVGIGLLLLDPQLSWYVGLSGALYGLLLGGAIAEYRNHKPISLLLVAYTVGKIVWEQLYGAVESSERISGGTVIVNAHMYGMVAGGLAVTAMLAVSSFLHRQPS